MEKLKVKCCICDKSIYRIVRNSKWFICSKKCRTLKLKNSNIGDKNPHWKGGFSVRSDGRKMVYIKGHPNAYLCGSSYILEYRLVAEKKLGRYLKDDEIVHHVNGDITDNRPENLEVTTQSKHAFTHSMDRKRNISNGRFL